MTTTTQILIAIPLILIGLILELAGLFVMAQAFPEIAAAVWSWITSLSILQIVTGVVGYFLYKFGQGWNIGIYEAVKEDDF